jgi:dihydroflavonol-4-reductase
LQKCQIFVDSGAASTLTFETNKVGVVVMSDLVLATGASGYIAGHVILQLLARGYRVRGTIRSLTRADEVRNWLSKAHGADIPNQALELIEADLSSDSGWDAAMLGVRYVLHIASPFPPKVPKNADELIAPARDGTLRIMHAASRASVERVVQTSSTVAIAYGHDYPDGRVFTEEDWTNLGHPEVSPYARSKTIAERAAWAELPKLDRAIEWVVINPGGVLGPVLDKDASASVDIVKKLLDKSVPGLPRFGFPIVDVRDLADLHLRAMLDPKAAGKRFIGSGDFLWMAEIAKILKTELGARGKIVPMRKLPDFMVRLVGIFDPVVRAQLHELGKMRNLSSDQAHQILGWKQRPLKETIVDTANSLFAVGAV